MKLVFPHLLNQPFIAQNISFYCVKISSKRTCLECLCQNIQKKSSQNWNNLHEKCQSRESIRFKAICEESIKSNN